MSIDTDVHVIGAGLGGLATAALVARAGRSVTVHESRNRLGGRATTDDRSGFRFNQGPHAFYLGGEAAPVLRRLGVVAHGVTPPTNGTQMMRDGQVGLAPVSPLSLLRTRLLSSRQKLEVAAILARLPRLDPSRLAPTPVGDWVDSLSDASPVREVLHTLVRLATYVNAPAQLSADVAVLQIQRALRDGVSYLDGGWEQLVSQLAAAPDVHIRTGERVTELPDAPAVVIAAGGPEVATSLTGHAYPTPIRADVSVLDLGLADAPLHDVVLGLDQPLYLSNHSVAADMVPDGRSSVSLAQYLAPGDEPDRGLLDAFAAQSGIRADQVIDDRHLHRMTAVTSIPTADSGGLAGRPGVAVPGAEGVFVVGDWVGGRGHLLDAVLASAEQAAAGVVAHLDRRPVRS